MRAVGEAAHDLGVVVVRDRHRAVRAGAGGMDRLDRADSSAIGPISASAR
jgi:hypothetical protein